MPAVYPSQEVRAICASGLPDYKQPARYERIDAKALRERLAK